MDSNCSRSKYVPFRCHSGVNHIKSPSSVRYVLTAFKSHDGITSFLPCCSICSILPKLLGGCVPRTNIVVPRQQSWKQNFGQQGKARAPIAFSFRWREQRKYYLPHKRRSSFSMTGLTPVSAHVVVVVVIVARSVTKKKRTE